MFKHLLQAISGGKNFTIIPDQLALKNPVHLENIAGSFQSLILASISGSSSSVLIITPAFEEALAIGADLEQLGAENVLRFPPTNKKPYDDEKLIDVSVMVQRSEVLELVKARKKFIIVTSAAALSEKLLSGDDFLKASITLKKADQISPDTLKEKLTDQGYIPVRFVDAPGEFAVRGGIFDIYPFSGDYPVRLEFFGDEIDSIREFDPDSQRSIAFLDETKLIPNVSYQRNGSTESLFKYLTDNTLIYIRQPELIQSQIEETYTLAEEIFTHSSDSEDPQPSHLYITADEYKENLNRFSVLYSGSFKGNLNSGVTTIQFNTSPHPVFNGSFKLLREFITDSTKRGYRTLILCDNSNQKERFDELLGEAGDDFNYALTVETLHEGFILNDEKLNVLTDHQIFNRYYRPKSKKKKVKGGISFKELKDLNVGDYVVHVDFGIAQFSGFKKIKVREHLQEAAVLRYQDDSILYVNVGALHKIQKYSGKEGSEPRITKLGTNEWSKKKARTKSRVKDIARDLIRLYAERKSKKAFEFSPDTAWQTEMEARFEYEETPDQMTAIDQVKSDLESQQPMDRLICGDVGFGKTEIAIRAAFKTVMDQKQVAVLVPTTILADQHGKTFSKRMSEFPVRIESLSRFKSAKEQKEIIEELEAGNVDIVIGTHRLLSNDVKFKDLGLLVIDEEQRFGVAMKEKLKKFRAAVDVLTMTATPIPRTLQFSLMGARDLSIINTPPPNRQPVYTEIHSFSEELIKDAILQETSRGGQIFFIHNRVKNIEETADMIRALVPDIRVRHAHGQMSATQLEKIISDFYSNKFDVLVSTNIVENGIDIANANTIIINNANHFGLSELHQLRGRVGRSNRKAFCYLITPPVQNLSPEARKRLMALEEYSDLGSGFNIAMRDLDIRGAGDMLGAEQSGFINDIGFELYTKILDEAVRELKETEFKDSFDLPPSATEYPDTQIDFDFSAMLDSDYVSDNVERLNLYRRLAEASDATQIDELEAELTDRFGPLNKNGSNLFLISRIKLYASRLFITKVTIRSDRMWLNCPAANSNFAKDIYENGFFQQVLQVLESVRSNRFQLLQKNETMRLVIQDIPNADVALYFLKDLNQELTVEKSTAV